MHIFQSQSRLRSPARTPGTPGVTRVKPPVPVRTTSLDRKPSSQHISSEKYFNFSQKLSFYEDSEGDHPTGFDDTKTPTNENVNLLSNLNNNNYAVPRGPTINVNQFEVPPPSYDQITWGWSTQYQELLKGWPSKFDFSPWFFHIFVEIQPINGIW